jgi:hypothetical protein
MDSVQMRWKMKERDDGTYLIEYTVTLQSATQLQRLMESTRPVRVPLSIFINDEPLPGSPFQVELTLRKMDLNMVAFNPRASSPHLNTTATMSKPVSALVRVQSIIRMYHALVLYGQLQKMYRLRSNVAFEVCVCVCV